MSRKFRIVVSVPDDWANDADDLKQILMKESDFYARTYCDEDIVVEEEK